MDFKHYDDKTLKKYTGVGTEQIKKNFESICAKGRQLHIRIPLVNGINTEYPELFSEYFSQYNTENVVFEFLEYHEYGKEKWTEEYRVKDGFVSVDIVKKFIKEFENSGLKIINT